MIRNYIKTAIRSLTKNKAYSFLNIFGLSIGIACAALIFLWVEDEVNFDNVYTKKDNLYIVRENQKYDTYVFTESSTPGLMGPAMKAEIPGVANTCRTSEGTTSLLFSKGDKSVFADGKYVEPSFFSMFSTSFVQGNPASAFNDLHSIVITEKAAIKFFGNTKTALGQYIKVDNKQDYVVTGVVKNLPANASIQFEWLMPFKIYFDQSPWLTNWGNQSLSTYVELKPGASASQVDKILYNYIIKRSPRSLGHAFLFGMNQWHLYDDFKDGRQTGGGQIEYVHLFTVIAWIILFIACINFMNLATARSEKRAREVGVRKVLGAGKNSLALQFIAEAVFMSLIAAVVAVVIVYAALPAFNTLVQKQLVTGFSKPVHIAGLLLITLICGLVAGSYPSLYLSSFSPVSVLKGVKIKDSGAALIRKGLVVMQFTASIVLIISTVIIYQQIQHIKSRQLGFNKNNLIEIGLQGDLSKNFDAVKQDLLSSGNVDNVALSDHAIIYGGNNTSGLTWDGKPPGSQVLISQRYVTPGFFETAGMNLVEGRNLTVADTGRPLRMVITNSLAKLMGKGSAIGKRVHGEGDTTSATVVGVVNDYVYGNMYGKPDPVMFFSTDPKNTTVMYARIAQHKPIETSLNIIRDVLKKNNPAYPFDYRFVDDQFNQMFLNEMLISKLSRVFATLAIIISCLGLFGLAAYTAERRTKEIGIRKVLGASVLSVASLLSLDFLKLVALSCCVAFPAAYWVMQNWLKGYQYHIGISLWVFAAAGVAAVIIAVVTVSFQSIKAAIANPVDSLKNE
ncbi:ABC transporter permease [Mucilaginibacter ginsenosidivorax]|uniref:FtsX-like permease family protein n=1 Tax=Mucilaginibacter ginsenosidivorax TaxID=862126 RepID=A0A5B8VT57_9SPHI|nr:ABC transporter permease [Mucilaginibacter ginsenosidivorax]QEC74463.1 FtsX-like permease family protein [Mucilaginibacter ginsenosidivorax]